MNDRVLHNEQINLNVIEKFLEELPEKAFHLGTRVILAIVVFILGVQLIRIIRKIIKKSMKRANAETGVVQFMDSFIKAVLYILLIFMIASGFGLDAASVVAVLGSAGVAIGLAVQGSLSNFAGGVLILLLKPFKVGDYIIEDSNKNEGTVQEIQLFYTKLATPDNKIIILPNGTLANVSLTNVSACQARRVDIAIGISYEADIRYAKQVITDLLRADEDTLKDRDLFVYVDSLGDSSVVLGVRCWFLNEDYWTGKWRITEEIKYALDEHNIAIPYPQMDVHIISEEAISKS